MSSSVDDTAEHYLRNQNRIIDRWWELFGHTRAERLRRLVNWAGYTFMQNNDFDIRVVETMNFQDTEGVGYMIGHAPFGCKIVHEHDEDEKVAHALANGLDQMLKHHYRQFTNQVGKFDVKYALYVPFVGLDIREDGRVYGGTTAGLFYKETSNG